MKEYNKNALASHIKELRNQKRLSQSAFAEQLHVSQQTIGAWETGRAIPGSDTLDALADYFDVSSDYLLGKTNDPTPANKKEKNNSDTALTWEDLGMAYGGEIPEELKETYADIAKGYFKRHPEFLNKNNK